MTEAHIRIDEGIKRPRNAPPPPLASGRAITVHKRPLNQIPVEERQRIACDVLDRYINGEQVATIAPDYGVSDVTIYALLLREHEDTWKDIQTARALARLEKNQDNLATASDALSLARARELVRSAQWELERLLNRLYAQKQEVTLDVKVDLSKALQAISERMGATLGATQIEDKSDIVSDQ